MKLATSANDKSLSILRLTIRSTTSSFLLGSMVVLSDSPASVSSVVLKKAAETVATSGWPCKTSPFLMAFNFVSIAVILRWSL